MSRAEFDETLHRVTANTFEALALMFLVPEDEAPASTPEDEVSASVTFTGPCEGALVLSVADEIMPELAENMLGLEDGSDATLAHQEDALKELANVICGNLLPELAGTKAVFHISAPALSLSGQRPDGFRSEPAATAKVCVEMGTVHVALFADAAAFAGIEVVRSEA